MDEKLKVKKVHSNMFVNSSPVDVILEDEKGFTAWKEISHKKFLKFLNKHIDEILEMVE